MNRRSARNRHRDIVLPKMQVKKNYVDPRDFQQMVSLGGQLLPKHVAQAVADTSEVVRAGAPPTVVAALAGAGMVIRAVGQAVARHAPPPPEGVDLKEHLPPWAYDVLKAIGLVPPEAPPPAKCTCDVGAIDVETTKGCPVHAPEPEKPEPVKDDLDLAARAAAADIVIAS